MKKSITLAAVSVALMTGVAQSAITTFDNQGGAGDGNLFDGANWDNGLPTTASGNIGEIHIDGTGTAVNNVTGWGALSLESGTLTVSNDWSLAGSNFTMNGGTLIVTDDIFVNNANYVFNAGDVDFADKFEPNGSGSGVLTINGGNFTSSGYYSTFGNTQNGSTIIKGGTFNLAGRIWFTTGSSSIGGAAVLSGRTGDFGNLDIDTDWSGSMTFNGFEQGSNWESQFTSGDITLDGNTLDAPGFASKFEVTNGGKTLALIPVPEPSSTALLGLGGLALILRRRK